MYATIFSFVFSGVNTHDMSLGYSNKLHLAAGLRLEGFVDHGTAS